MSIELKKLCNEIQNQIDKIKSRHSSTQFKLEFDPTKISLHVTFEKMNKLGDWFVCTVHEKRFPLNNEIIGITIDYYDSNNYLHYFIRRSDGDHEYLTVVKILANIFEEFRSGELFVRGSRYHIQHTSDSD